VMLAGRPAEIVALGWERRSGQAGKQPSAGSRTGRAGTYPL